MTNVIYPVSVQRMVCTGCGAEANASCNCGKPYVPKSVRAAEAIKANPEKSDRAIAAEIGVHKNTVSRARNELAHNGPVAETRIGLDGKTRRMPTPASTPQPLDKDKLRQVQAFRREMSQMKRESDALFKNKMRFVINRVKDVFPLMKETTTALRELNPDDMPDDEWELVKELVDRLDDLLTMTNWWKLKIGNHFNVMSTRELEGEFPND